MNCTIDAFESCEHWISAQSGFYDNLSQGFRNMKKNLNEFVTGSRSNAMVTNTNKGQLNKGDTSNMVMFRCLAEIWKKIPNLEALVAMEAGQLLEYKQNLAREACGIFKMFNRDKLSNVAGDDGILEYLKYSPPEEVRRLLRTKCSKYYSQKDFYYQLKSYESSDIVSKIKNTSAITVMKNYLISIHNCLERYLDKSKIHICGVTEDRLIEELNKNFRHPQNDSAISIDDIVAILEIKSLHGMAIALASQACFTSLSLNKRINDFLYKVIVYNTGADTFKYINIYSEGKGLLFDVYGDNVIAKKQEEKAEEKRKENNKMKEDKEKDFNLVKSMISRMPKYNYDTLKSFVASLANLPNKKIENDELKVGVVRMIACLWFDKEAHSNPPEYCGPFCKLNSDIAHNIFIEGLVTSSSFMLDSIMNKSQSKDVE